MGASVIMTEVPEMFGAEQILMSRSKDKAVYQKIINMINGFKEYFIEHGESVSDNPSPGNKEGGITTLEEKSLGCIQKGGGCIVNDVIKYGERVKVKGLTLLEAPGNDIVAQTALAAAGAHIILFTTGRGTPLGAAVPTIKISSNTYLAENKPHWIDFNAGQFLENENLNDLRDKLIDLIINTANGKKTNNEKNNYRDFAIWKNGVTL
jgi:altronate hydrolase